MADDRSANQGESKRRPEEPLVTMPSEPVARERHRFSWFPQLILVGIFGWAVVTKFTGHAGPLASKLPGGEAAVWIIGTVELIALVLLLIPATAVQGAVIAGTVMLFAITAHLSGVVGFDGPFAFMFALALLGFACAAAVVALRWDQIERFSRR